MTRKLFEDNMSRAHLEFTAMFDALSHEYRSSVVMRALRARDHVSTDAGRGAGFRHTGQHTYGWLFQPSPGNLVGSLGTGKRISKQVRKTRHGHPAGLGPNPWRNWRSLCRVTLLLKACPPITRDFDNSRFRGFWDEDSWQKGIGLDRRSFRNMG